MTYEDVAKGLMAYAEKNYETGWDHIVETRTVEDLAAEFRRDGITSVSEAIIAYRPVMSVLCSQRDNFRHLADKGW